MRLGLSLVISCVLGFLFNVDVSFCDEDNEYDAWEDMIVGCGVNKIRTPRIMGGTAAVRGEFPWMTVLRKRKMILCTGVLIARKLVITIAHGTYRHKNAEGLNAVLGAFNVDDLKSDKAVQFIEIEEIWVHANFTLRSMANDVALVRLGELGAFWTGWVQPICLPPPQSSNVGRFATVVGWGAKETGGQTTPTLNKVTIEVYPIDRCIPAYFPTKNLTGSSHICAGVDAADKDACQGDSGGPLMVRDSSRWVLIGMVSMGKLCGDPEAPGVYTNVSTYIPWMKEYVLTHVSTNMVDLS